MPTIEVNGRDVEVDDSFLRLSPEQQNATVDEIAKSIKPKAGVAEDMVKNFAAGVGRGAADLIGLPGTIGDLLKTGVNKGLDYILPPAHDPALAQQKMQSPVSGNAMRDYASAATGGGTDYQAQTTPGKYAGTVGEFVPGALAFGGGTVGSALRYGVLPGVASEAAGQATEGTAAEPYARLGAAVLAPTVGAKLASRVITPNPAGPTRLKAAELLKKEGVPLTAGQKTGSRKLMYAESVLGGGKADDIVQAQEQAFTKAAMKSIGENADNAAPEAMTTAFKRITGTFDDLASRHDIPAERQLVADLRDAKNGYNMTVSASNRAPFVEKDIADIVNELRTKGRVTGAMYKDLRTRLGKIIKGGGKEGDTAAEIQGALDAAMERSLVLKGSPDVGAWKEIRRQYRNYLVLERAAGGAGASTVREGILTPQQLRAATKQIYGLRNYTQGAGDLTELARAGAGVMEKLPQSGTGPRLAAAGGMLSAGVGATLFPSNPVLGGMAGVAAGTAIPRIAGGAILSAPGRGLLGNQLVPNVDIFTGEVLGRTGAISGGRALSGRE